jgi:hypothetical protein
MKYLRKFATGAEIADLAQPNVVLVADTKEVLYNFTPFGVYIQHIDGNLYTKEAWEANAFSNNLANGIAVHTSEASFVMAKSSATIINQYWESANDVVIENVTTTTTSSIAKQDYKGKENTKYIVQNSVSGAAHACVNYKFPNGEEGYLASAGEWGIACAFKTEIEAALGSIGESGYAVYCWTSTQYDATKAWFLRWLDGVMSSTTKKNFYAAVPFAPLNI